MLQGSDTTREGQSLQLHNEMLRTDVDQRSFTAPIQMPMQQSVMQLNIRRNSLNMMGMLQGSVPPNSVMRQMPFNFFYDQQQLQQPSSNANAQVINPQEIYNTQQMSNLTDFRMGLVNPSNLMVQSFGSHPQAVGNVSMQPNQLLQHQQQTLESIRPQLINGGNAINLNFQRQLSSLQGLQQQSTHSAPDLFFPLSLGEEQNRGDTDINFANTGGGNDRAPGLVPRSEHFPTGGSAASSEGDGDERTALDVGNNDGGDASPLSPNSFRW